MEYLKYYNSYASLFNTSQHSHVGIILFLLVMVFLRLDVVILIMLLVLTGNFSQRTKRKPSNRLHTKGHSFLTELKVNIYPVIDTCLTSLYICCCRGFSDPWT